MPEQNSGLQERTLTQLTAPYLTRGVDLNELLVSLVDAIVNSVAADRGTLYLVDGARQSLTSMVAQLPELDKIQLSFGQGVAGSVAQTQKALNVPDVRFEPRFDPTFDQRTGYETKSLLAVPISDSRGETIGVMQLLNAKGGVFAKADEEKGDSLERASGPSTGVHKSLC